MNLHYWKFPLLPIIERQKRTEHRRPSFRFQWLAFCFGTISSFEIGLNLLANIGEGIGIIIILPYFSVSLIFPIPDKICNFVYKLLYLK